MAIYAFDGTCSEDKKRDEMDTNVIKFYNAYKSQYEKPENCFYVEGVGTRYSILGLIAGGMMGAGGQQRIDEAFEALQNNFEKGDEEIDIIGFSRGAALSLEFANTIKEQGVEKSDGEIVKPEIRFLGLWDTVGSFGIPGNNINIGYTLTVPAKVKETYHAIALDERRHTFPLSRLVQDSMNAREKRSIFEVWFRGFHADVGGGNDNEGLSGITLHWMLKRAKASGLPIGDDVIKKHSSLMNTDAKPKKPGMDLIANPKRTICRNDVVHESVKAIEKAGRFSANNPPVGLRVVGDDGELKEKGFGG